MACWPSQPHAAGGMQWHPSAMATHRPRDADTEQAALVGHAQSSFVSHSLVFVHDDPTPPSTMGPGQDRH